MVVNSHIVVATITRWKQQQLFLYNKISARCIESGKTVPLCHEVGVAFV